MDKINFEYNQSTLNQSAVRHLDAVYELLTRYPNMAIELIVHTDTRGDASKTLPSPRPAPPTPKTIWNTGASMANASKLRARARHNPATAASTAWNAPKRSMR